MTLIEWPSADAASACDLGRTALTFMESSGAGTQACKLRSIMSHKIWRRVAAITARRLRSLELHCDHIRKRRSLICFWVGALRVGRAAWVAMTGSSSGLL